MATHHVEKSGEAVEIEFRVPDRRLFFVDASGDATGRVSLAELFPRADGRLLEYFTIEGVPPDRVFDLVADEPSVDEARLVRSMDDGSLFEFVVSGPCIAGTLADAGAAVRAVSARAGVGRVVADVPPHADVREVVESVQELHDAELVARRERDRPAPAFTKGAFRETLVEQLTERQLETLRTALAAGYYRWPREATAEECAERLDIAQPTFTQHLRAGERKVLEALFDESRQSEAPPAAR